jgi:hypothetical protein
VWKRIGALDFFGFIRLDAMSLKTGAEIAGDRNRAEVHTRHKKLGEGFLVLARLKDTQNFCLL